MSTPTRYAAACLAAASLLLTGCGSSGNTHAPTTSTSNSAATVEVNHMAFAPDTVTVHVGDTVTWKFDDRFPHSVEGLGDNGMVLNSPIVDRGTWSFTFTAPGEYHYTCQLHPEMTGVVVVK